MGISTKPHHLSTLCRLACCILLPLAGANWAQIFLKEETRLEPQIARVVFGDFDNDGYPDILHRDFAGQHVLLHNEGEGQFAPWPTAITTDHPLQAPEMGFSAADYDNDGDLDLYIPTPGIIPPFTILPPERDVLLRNDMGTFRDVTREANLDDATSSLASIWLDYDLDGDLDLCVSHLDLGPETDNNLYRNRGDGTFEDVTAAVGLDVPMGGALGMAGADFNEDGWPDLYFALFLAPNRLFLSDGQGKFEDATSGEIAIEGNTWGLAVGDIDNDGHLDIFQPNLSLTQPGEEDFLPSRSPMLQNLGAGLFLDITEGVGLGVLIGKNVSGGSLVDIDNDGDLDLTFLSPRSLFINNGDLTFVEADSRGGISLGAVGDNLDGGGRHSSVGDYDLDGFPDVFIGGTSEARIDSVTLLWPEYAGGLHRNQGNDHHYLRVELVGVQSNRSGIGAKLLATAGDLHQIREILGGKGRDQDELVAHFGLGPRTQVDSLEIRWPSGQIDLFTDIPADQKIRAFEGRDEYHVAEPTTWTVEPPTSLNYGETNSIAAVVNVALYEPGAEIARVHADLSSLGGPADVPLEDLGDGAYRLETDFSVGGDPISPHVAILIEQETSLGMRWTRLTRTVTLAGAPITAILEDHTSSLPSSFALDQNHPNPFNSATVIRFSLPQTVDISLSLYNLTGQQVATLVSGKREAGTYTLRWDGRDDQGRNLASGVYLYRLRAGAQMQTRKLLLLR